MDFFYNTVGIKTFLFLIKLWTCKSIQIIVYGLTKFVLIYTNY